MATFAPSAARRLAIAAPMPREPPVMSAIFPSSFLVIFSSCFFNYVSIGIQITLDKSVSNDLFTHRYEIRDYRGTARTTACLRPGRRLGTRHARFLGQRLRR